MKLKFTKMEGAGNDFVMIDVGAIHESPLQPETIRKICDRRFGVGCDQLLVVAPSKKADFRMDIYNADGSQVEMCGNGIRCLAKYVQDKKISSKAKLDVETLAGIIKPEILAEHPGNSHKTLWVKVDMGEPTVSGEMKVRKFTGTSVSMGNPHYVVFVDQVDNYPVWEYGRSIEADPRFPNRVNVEFIQVLSQKEFRMRVWERGAGETHACGTGACAAVVASVLNKKTGREVLVHLKGGNLEINWDEKTNHVLMTGPATTVFEGEIEI
ncbi:MAG: diaminopimelate epimerase [Deltaproteobacteria bacterium]|nr:diaminopimelate epimerase [Deltaproteobacteria bacterium]